MVRAAEVPNDLRRCIFEVYQRPDGSDVDQVAEILEVSRETIYLVIRRATKRERLRP